MKKLIKTLVLIPFTVIVLSNCDDRSGRPSLPTEETNFAYVATGDDYTDNTLALNQWLRVNPNKKVVSFSSVLYYRSDARGYIVYFVPGNNSKQKFERVAKDDKKFNEPMRTVYGMHALQYWRDTHKQTHLVAISTVAEYSGGVKEFIICFEE